MQGYESTFPSDQWVEACLSESSWMGHFPELGKSTFLQITNFFSLVCSVAKARKIFYCRQCWHDKMHLWQSDQYMLSWDRFKENWWAHTCQKRQNWPRSFKQKGEIQPLLSVLLDSDCLSILWALAPEIWGAEKWTESKIHCHKFSATWVKTIHSKWVGRKWAMRWKRLRRLSAQWKKKRSLNEGRGFKSTNPPQEVKTATAKGVPLLLPWQLG